MWRWARWQYLLVLGVAVTSCRDEGANNHVYQAPRPVAPRPPVVYSPPVPQLPIGATGPEARITEVNDGATGAPVTLSSIVGPFSVLALVGRGPYESMSSRGASITLVIDGPTDTTFALPLDPPAPVIIAHAFPVPVARAGGVGLRSGHYSARIRLVIDEQKMLAESMPIYFTVAR